MTKPKCVKSGGRINYEDDCVCVVDNKGNVIYQGLEDYNPLKDEQCSFIQTTKTNKGYYKYNNIDCYAYKLN